MDDKDLLTAIEAAEMLGISRSMLQKHIDLGHLKPVDEKTAIRKRRKLRFNRSDIEALVKPKKTND